MLLWKMICDAPGSERHLARVETDDQSPELHVLWVGTTGVIGSKCCPPVTLLRET